jgi:hypothetical protein
MLKLTGDDLFYENGVKLGQVLAKEDGFYDFWPELNGGYWPAHMLRAIADMLDEMNYTWEQTIANDPALSSEDE